MNVDSEIKGNTFEIKDPIRYYFISLSEALRLEFKFLGKGMTLRVWEKAAHKN